MKIELNFLELHFLTGELQECIGARVDNIYGKDFLIIQLHKTGAGKTCLNITKNLVWLSDKRAETQETTGFCTQIRKLLKGKKITAIDQPGSERIIKITLKTQRETTHAYIELFSNGNLVVTDEKNKIIAAKEERKWKDREIRRGSEYALPPQKNDLFSLKEIPDDEKEIANLGLGRLIAREIKARGGGIKAYKELLNEKLNPKSYPDGEISPIRLAQYPDGESHKTFSELINKKFSEMPAQGTETEHEKEFSRKKEKISEIVKIQAKTAEGADKEAAELQFKGELIYKHYQELKDVLEELNKAKTKLSLQEIREKLKGHPKIKKVEPRTGEITIEIH